MAGLFDFESFPVLQRWVEAMKQLPCHDEVHSYNLTLGDIAATPNTEERFAQACAAGMAALGQCGVSIRPMED